MKKSIGFVFMMVSFSISSCSAPYIPSYDDRYQEDIRQAESNRGYFIEPSDSIKYDHYHYVGAHAAEKYPRFFPEYSLQEQTIPAMLYAGVRGLMLSTYNWSLSWSSIIREGISVVCSHPTQETIIFRKNGKPLYQTLHYEMNRVFNFLKSHPMAVITILLDDFADIKKIVRDFKEIVMKNSYDPILKPSDWSLAQEKGEWPTLGWLRKNNKRLIMFTQTHDKNTEFTWPLKQYFWENVYGTVDENLICIEDKESVLGRDKTNRALVSFGVFGSVAISPGARDFIRCFEYDIAKRLTTVCKNKGFARGNLFNAYWADHIISSVNALGRDGKKTAFDYVNEMNAAEGKQDSRMGTPIEE